MSIRMMTDVWEKSQHKGSDLLLLLALADFADDAGHNIFPSVATLADKTRLTERAVQISLRRIEASGEISIRTGEHMMAKGVYTNEIAINVDRLGVVIERGENFSPLTPTSTGEAETAPTGRGENFSGVNPSSPNPSSNNDTSNNKKAHDFEKPRDAEFLAQAKRMGIKQGHAALLQFGFQVDLVDRITHLFGEQDGFQWAICGAIGEEFKPLRLRIADQLLSRIGVENLSKSMKRLKITQHLGDNCEIIRIIGEEWQRIGYDKHHLGLMINRLMEAPQVHSETSAEVTAFREIKAGQKLLQEALV